MKLGGKQNTVDQKLLVNRFLPLQEQNDTKGKVRDNVRLETVQYQNPQQTRRDTSNRQNYQPNVIVNNNQENDIPEWEQKRVP